ncbi:MAG: hypothetical protein HOP19_24940, partial [Acidobacteria bacterium]|nr:hypothetical protein [Acidobacteriota bacterium]
MLKPLSAVLLSALFLCWFDRATLWQSSAQTRPYTIQTSSKETEDEARNEASKLAAAGFAAHWLKAEVTGKGTRYRVRFGRYNSQAEAKARAEQAVKNGVIKEYIITLYETPTALVAARRPAPTATSTPIPKPVKVVGEEKPVMAKGEPNPETSTTREVKPSKVAVIPIKPVTNEPPAAPVNKEPDTPKPNEKKTAETASAEVPKTAPDNVTPPLVIASPPMAEALGEVDFTNRNWKVVRKSTVTDKNLRAVYFVDSMTGWTAGDAGALHRTTDGGKTWKPLLAGVPATITQIQFIDWNTGWLLGEQTRKDDELVET